MRLGPVRLGPPRPASRRRARVAALAAAWLLVACAPVASERPAASPAAVVTPAEAVSAGVLPPLDPALALPGPYEVDVEAGALRSAYGCEVRFEVLTPRAPGADGDAASVELLALPLASDVTVLWAHGFLRDLSSMRGWAEHAASHGLRSVAVSFCNASPFAGRHERNAEDLRRVADAARDRPNDRVVYAGFSAGGWSALLAARADPNAIGYLGLDAVVSEDQPTEAVRWRGPALFLLGEPSSCNAQGNAEALAGQLPEASFVRVAGASHCDFEDPYDPRCAWVCGRAPAEAVVSIRETIRTSASAWLLQFVGTGQTRP